MRCRCEAPERAMRPGHLRALLPVIVAAAGACSSPEHNVRGDAVGVWMLSLEARKMLTRPRMSAGVSAAVRGDFFSWPVAGGTWGGPSGDIEGTLTTGSVDAMIEVHANRGRVRLGLRIGLLKASGFSYSYHGEGLAGTEQAGGVFLPPIPALTLFMRVPVGKDGVLRLEMLPSVYYQDYYSTYGGAILVELGLGPGRRVVFGFQARYFSWHNSFSVPPWDERDLYFEAAGPVVGLSFVF